MRAYSVCFLLLSGLASTVCIKGDTFTIQPLTHDLLQALRPYERTGSSQPGHSVSTDGQTVFLNIDGNVTSIDEPLHTSFPGRIDLIGLDGFDRIYAIDTTGHMAENGLWRWDGSWQLLATADIFYAKNPSPVVNYWGQVALRAGSSAYPVFWDGDQFVWISKPDDPLMLLSWLDLNNTGQALYVVAPGFADRAPLLYVGGQHYWLSDLIAPTTGWSLDDALNLQLYESGYITGTAPYNGTLADFVMGPGVLTPVPEPGTAVLLATSIAGLYWIRKRRLG